MFLNKYLSYRRVPPPVLVVWAKILRGQSQQFKPLTVVKLSSRSIQFLWSNKGMGLYVLA